MTRLNQAGSHIIAFALVVAALGVVGFAGYKVQQSHNNSSSANGQATVTEKAVPKAVTNAADLQTVSKILDDASAQLNTSLDDSSLNADLNSML